MNLFAQIKLFLIESKNRQIFFLSLAAIFVLVLASVLVAVSISNTSTSPKNEVDKTAINIKKENKNNLGEIINLAAYDTTCQVVVTTSQRKIFLQKVNRCNQPLVYKISSDGKYLSYLLPAGNSTKIFVFSAENNIEASIDLPPSPVIDLIFTKTGDLAVLYKQTFSYYFIPLIFSGYPDNFDEKKMIFTDTGKKKVNIDLSDLPENYAKIQDSGEQIAFLDPAGRTVYIISISDITSQLMSLPTGINKSSLDWTKRIFFYDRNTFKTVDYNGENEIVERFSCRGNDVIPINFFDNLFARSPDGTQLVFLIPNDGQIRENPTWKNDLLAKKRIFNKGQIILYDLVKDECLVTDLTQSINFRENFSFSPNGLYLAYVDRGVGLYNIVKKSYYQLVDHNPVVGANPTAVTGPLIWDGSSKFIYTTVSRLENGAIISTKLVRIYFNERFEGQEQEVVSPFPSDSHYGISSDGNKAIYTKDNNIFVHDVDKKINTLFKSGIAQNSISKMVWLKNNLIVSNSWLADDNLNFINLPKNHDFEVDYSGDNFIYIDGMTINMYNLSTGKLSPFKKILTPQGTLLKMFY